MKLHLLISLAVLFLFGSLAVTAQASAGVIESPAQSVALSVDHPAGQITMSFPSLEALGEVLSGHVVNGGTDSAYQAAPTAYAFQQTVPMVPVEDPEPDKPQGILDWLMEYQVVLGAAILALIELFVAIVPTSVDWTGFKWLRALIYWAIPNRNKIGGRHPSTPQ